MIYLDANATSKLRPGVVSALKEHLGAEQQFGNPSSVTAPGRKAKSLIVSAKKIILDFLLNGQKTDAQLFFTSGGTEGCNAIISGFIDHVHEGHILSTSIEHSAIQEPLKSLSASGLEVEHVSPNANGFIDLEEFTSKVRTSTVLVSIMLANNETGAIQPVLEIAKALRAKKYSGPIVSDITQAIGKSELNLRALFDAGVNAVSISGHKMGALTGVGAVILAGASSGSCFQFAPSILGGGQQNGFRSGTENLLGILSLKEAAVELKLKGDAEQKAIRALRDYLWETLASEIYPIRRLTPLTNSLGNTLQVQIPGCRSDDLVVALDLVGVAASRGSACNSGKQNTSYIPVAMGLSQRESNEVIRFSLDWDATDESISQAAAKIIQAVRQMRTINAQRFEFAKGQGLPELRASNG